MTQEEKLEEAKRLYKDANADQRYVLERLFPELNENEDERIKKALIRNFTNQHSSNFPTADGFTREQILDWLEKQGEQKSAGKVEPMFKIGNWVVTDKNDVVQIKAVNNGYYTIGNGMDFNISYVDRCWHLWTIQDAKDGDVLCVKYGNDELPFIFTGKQDDVAYCALNSFGEFVLSIAEWLLKTSVLPATKEQRDTLMKAMADAGYTFDFNKKELKKKDAVIIETSMMEDDCDDLTPVIGDMRNKGFNFGDRVKVIIVKEE